MVEGKHIWENMLPGMESEQDGGPWIVTHSGKKFFLLNPTDRSIVGEDIAHNLSMICRFTGSTYTHYSVAQHCCLVSDMLLEVTEKGKYLAAMLGLLHDASEAYVGDVNAPLKSLLPEYKVIEARIQDAILRKFGLVGIHQISELQMSIRAVDLRMCQTEYEQLIPNKHPDWALGTAFDIKIIPWSAPKACSEFLWRLNNLRGKL